MDATELETIVRNWNAEIETVTVLKTAFDSFGKTSEEITMDDNCLDLWDAVCCIDWAGTYAGLSLDTPFMERNDIMTIDHEGNCLCYDFQIKKVSELI